MIMEHGQHSGMLALEYGLGFTVAVLDSGLAW